MPIPTHYRIIFPLFAGILAASSTAPVFARPLIWQPYQFQPGMNFRYEVIDHEKKTKGEFSLEIQQDGNQLKALTKSHSDKEPEYEANVTETKERLLEKSRSAMIRWPLAAPILSTVLSQWWEGFAGFDWQIGAQTTVGPVDVAPISAKVTENCALKNFKGLKAQLNFGKKSLGELCINPELPLPLWGKIYDMKGNIHYETQLIAYETAQSSSQTVLKTSLSEARTLASFTLFEPDYLPHQAKLIETRVVNDQNAIYVTLLYQFANEPRFFQIDEYLPNVKEPEWPQKQTLNTHNGAISADMLMLNNGVNALRWTLNKTRIVLNGALSAEEMYKIAVSMK